MINREHIAYDLGRTRLLLRSLDRSTGSAVGRFHARDRRAGDRARRRYGVRGCRRRASSEAR
jgi:hypothetical protein